MELFNIPVVPLHGEKITPVVETPLGRITYTAQVGGYELLKVPYSMFSVGDDSYIFKWMFPEAQVELLFFRPDLPDYLQGRVNDTWAGVWRVKALKSVDACYLSCRWNRGFVWVNGGQNSGEGLDAQSYQNGEFIVTIGTENYEYVRYRAATNDFMPIHLKPTDTHEFAEYLEDGLRIPCLGLETEDLCQFQYIIAWSRETDDVGHWLAVDRNYRDILLRFE